MSDPKEIPQSAPSEAAMEAAREWNPQCADCINGCCDGDDCEMCSGLVPHLASAFDAFAAKAVERERQRRSQAESVLRLAADC